MSDPLCVSLFVLLIFHRASYNLTLKEELLISRVAAMFLLAMYIQLLVFQMVTHKHLFTDVDRENADADADVDDDVSQSVSRSFVYALRSFVCPALSQCF